MSIFSPKQAGFTSVEYAIAGTLVSAALFMMFTYLGDAVAGSIAAITQVLDSGGSGSDSLAKSENNVWLWILPITLVIFTLGGLIQYMIRK